MRFASLILGLFGLSCGGRLSMKKNILNRNSVGRCGKRWKRLRGRGIRGDGMEVNESIASCVLCFPDVLNTLSLEKAR
jgi:hypothetical protein